MSLRFVHLVFISLAALLAVVFAIWAFAQYWTGGSALDLAAAAGATAAAAGLAAYAVSFQRRTRHW